MQPSSRDADREHGFVLVWFAAVLVLLLAVSAFVVDIVHGYSVAQQAQNAADAGALAGVVKLSESETSAYDLARQVAADNDVDVSDVTVDRVGANQLQVTIKRRIETFFGRFVGSANLDVTRTAIAEYEPPTPIDLVLIVDRTGSMSADGSINRVRPAANAVLDYFDPTRDRVALGLLGPSSTTDTSGCGLDVFGRLAAERDWYNASLATWLPAPFSPAFPADFQESGSRIRQTIACMNSAGYTDLGTPILQATRYLEANKRAGVKRGIIFMTDGAANRANGNPNPCGYAAQQAATATALGIEVLTIGYGVQGALCEVESAGSKYDDDSVMFVLADMASPIDGVAADTNGVCDDAENTDGDNFFCEPRDGTGDLERVFVQAAAQLANRATRLVR